MKRNMMIRRQMLSETQQNCFFDIFVEYEVSHTTIQGLLNIASTCIALQKRVQKKCNFPHLKMIHLISTPMFKRFVLLAQKVDRTDRPKSHVQEIFGYSTVYEVISISQSYYEIKELKRAYINSGFDYRRAVLFDKMGEEKRNKLLEAIKGIDVDQLISLKSLHELTVKFLLNEYTQMTQLQLALEVVLSGKNIFVYKKQGVLASALTSIFSFLDSM